MVNKRSAIEKKIAEITAIIEETRKRLPAHSTKPPIMMELLDLEDQYDQLIQQLNGLKTDEK